MVLEKRKRCCCTGVREQKNKSDKCRVGLRFVGQRMERNDEDLDACANTSRLFICLTSKCTHDHGSLGLWINLMLSRGAPLSPTPSELINLYSFCASCPCFCTHIIHVHRFGNNRQGFMNELKN